MSEATAVVSEFTGLSADAASVDVDVLFVPVFGENDRIDDVAGIDEAVGGEFRRALAGEFRATPFETFTARVSGRGWRASRLVFMGMPAELDAERVRRFAAACGYLARQRAMPSVGVLARRGLSARTLADGLRSAEFDGGSYKSRDRAGAFPARVSIVVPGAQAREVAEEVRLGQAIGAAANVARRLANEPGNVLTPREFARRVAEGAAAAGLGCDVLDEDRIGELGLRLMLSVAQGSVEPPRLIVLRYEPPNAPESPVLALVGKGVTFDSGGISIKPAEGMDRMKNDMAGGAAVAAAMRAIAELGGPCRVIGVIPSVENMPGGRAMRPGDVVIGASGTSVEIVNTDAEGRLILADALWYAQQLGATHLVDVATLTGACMVALGRHVSGLFGTPDDWVTTVREAAARAGDRVWPMPIYDEAREEMRSEIADLVNAGGRAGGAITAAAFLRAFTGDRPWVHLDVAGTAWSDARQPYQPKGSTGVAVRTLIELGMTAGGSRRA
jgi:leucyl aminopeptidase